MPFEIKRSNLIVSFLDIILVSFLFFDIGFTEHQDYRFQKLILLPVVLFTIIGFHVYRYYKNGYDDEIKKRAQYNLIILGILVLIEFLVILFSSGGSLIERFFRHRRVLEYGLLFFYFVRITFLMRAIYRRYFNPFIFFVGSFIIVILTGTLFLMLPSATLHPISFEDALFTATSAVCVTGLLAVDMATEFTVFGQTIMMVLIQLGGLGMLTFTTFFAYFFKTGGSFRESLYMKNVMGSEQLNDMMQTTVSIVSFALLVEFVGAIFIYDATRHLDLDHPFFFSVFHAVSAFCNGGFSTVPGNLQAPELQFNYYLQWILMLLIIFGGLGYFISFNFLNYIKQNIINLFSKKHKKAVVRIITLNTKIVIHTTILLIVFGTAVLYITEYKTVLPIHETFFGKLTTAAFSSVTARTTGFSTVDFYYFSPPGILIVIFLMWIGASPASTGGGIKTSSFALAVLNVFSVARNKRYIEIGTRRVAREAIRRAFAIIIVSLICIGGGILLVLIFDPYPKFSLLEVAFEVFSAFGTVGLSMGITPDLSHASQYVIITLMFVGRIGLINLMAGMLRKLKTQSYEYPKENILIN